MKRILALTPLVMAVTACGTFSSDPYEKRAERERERQEQYVERALDKSPKWMTELPQSKSAVYQNGTAVSRDLGMAVNKAKTMAFGKICMAAGGQVSQQSKIFMQDSDTASTEYSELAIRSVCPSVDISGIEVVDTRTVSEGSRFRSYVLVSLPTGEANAIQTRRDQQVQRRQAETRSREAFRELDNVKPSQ